MALLEHLDTPQSISRTAALGGDEARTSGPVDADEFHISVPESVQDKLYTALSPNRGPNAHKGERGAICLISESCGRRRLTYNIVDVLMPAEYGENDEREDDVQIDHDASFGGFLTFNDRYLNEARRKAYEMDGNIGLLIVHTHGAGASPSGPDQKSDREDLYATKKKLGDVPVAAGIRGDSDDAWHIRGYEFNVARTQSQEASNDFGIHTEETEEATAIRVVGDRIRKLMTTATREKMGPKGVNGHANRDLQNSTDGLWGRKGQECLAGLRVGIVGCGGVGGILAEWTARLGAGELVLVDFDRLELANFNRSQGATRSDIDEKRLKVEVAARVAEASATADEFNTRKVIGSVCEADRPAYDVLPDLLDCDIILNAADTHWARQVLNDIAYAYNLHVIDGGTILDVNASDALTPDSQSNVAVAGPKHPCLHCSGMWTHTGMGEDMTHPDHRGYVNNGGGQQDRAPSVISMNGLVASLVLQRFQALALGVAPEMTTGALRYQPHDATLRWRKDGLDELSSCKAECSETPDIGIGDSVNLDRGEDPELTRDIDDGSLPEPADLPVEPSDVTEATAAPTNTHSSREKSLIHRVADIVRNIASGLLPN